ncbi:MAG TPA: universal stress protein [Candidatus Cybelea sp.]|nr:universal stress protein [Candidatus Cybelea sp.]
MRIRTILAAISGGSARRGIADLACNVAHRFESHVEALHVRADPRELAMAAADGLGVVLTDVIQLTEQEARESAASARQEFEAAARRHGIAQQSDPPPVGGDPALLRRSTGRWSELVGYAPQKISDRARFFDLLILGRSGRVVDEPHSESIEEALLTTGRPVLIAPAEPPKRFGDVIGLAWNDSPESAKALAAAMPFLETARDVRLLSVGQTRASELAQHLAWYGIRASVDMIYPVKGAGIGELLLAAARDHGADLLVMGGYGHSPLREALFGGATRHIVGTSRLPLLLTH